MFFLNQIFPILLYLFIYKLIHSCHLFSSEIIKGNRHSLLMLSQVMFPWRIQPALRHAFSHYSEAAFICFIYFFLSGYTFTENMYDVISRNYSYLFNFEEKFEHSDTRAWMTKNWTISFYFCALYMILIFGGQHYMQSRPRFNLKGVLSVWNTLLATFSIMGALRTAPELFHVLKNHGIYYSICIPR